MASPCPQHNGAAEIAVGCFPSQDALTWIPAVTGEPLAISVAAAAFGTTSWPDAGSIERRWPHRDIVHVHMSLEHGDVDVDVEVRSLVWMPDTMEDGAAVRCRKWPV